MMSATEFPSSSSMYCRDITHTISSPVVSSRIIYHKGLNLIISVSDTMPKARRTITLDRKILEWAEKEIEEKRFASLSHAVEYALTKLMKEKNTS